MAITQAYNFKSSSVGTTEKSLTANSTSLQTNTTVGFYQLFIDDLGLMAAGDEYEIALLEKATSGSTQIKTIIGRLVAPLPEDFWASPTFMLVNGWDFSLRKVAGTDRSFDWSIRLTSGSLTQSYQYSGSSIGATEVSLTANTTTIQSRTTAGFYQLFLEALDLSGSDVFEVNVLEKIGDTQRRVLLTRFSGSQPDLFITPAFLLMSGWDFSMKKVVGTDRNVAWSIRGAV